MSAPQEVSTLEDWNHPVVGVLGGLGPAATAVFLDVLVRATAAEKDQDHLDLVVTQHSSTPDRTARVLDSDAPDPAPVIAADAERLVRFGAELLVLPCNTATSFVEPARRRVAVPFLSIAELTARAAVQVAGELPVAVLATRGTVRTGVYDHELAALGSSAWPVPEDMQQRIDTLIYDQVKAGETVDTELLTTAVREALDGGAGAVVLGCTELSVVYDQQGLRGDESMDRVVDSLTELARGTILAAGAQLSEAFARTR